MSGAGNVTVLSVRGHEAEIRVGDRTFVVPYIVKGSTVSFAFDGEIYTVDTAEKSSPGRARHRDQSTEAPMPGVVLKILAKAGDVVKKGAPLIVLEAMKMEHPISAPYDGTVAAVNCKEGEMVQPGVQLVILSREEREG
ncbi:MAG TPA: biotin/lipoyl-containing protein [Thermoanaerobaculia bacterium]|jgi:3-methylcrotonyl-CoA carboxylase alpha subunit